MIKSKKRQGGDEDSFYVSWGDLVSLLLVFFVYLFSISEIDYVKFLEATSSMKEEIINVKDETLEKLKIAQEKLAEIKTEIDEYIETENLQQVLTAEMLDDRLELRMGNVLLFGTGSADLKKRAQTVLDKIGNMFKSEATKIIVEGHTDDIPIKTKQFPSNWELSSARAAAVVRFLVESGVAEDQFLVMGYNQFSPMVPNDDSESRAKNRRVKIIIKPDVDKILQTQKSIDSSKTQANVNGEGVMPRS